MSTRRLQLLVAGEVYDWWTSVEITRDLSEISAGFLIELHDVARARRALPGRNPREAVKSLGPGQACEILLDEETVLAGWIDEVKISAGERDLTFSVAGRDKAGDLVDCAAAVDGPVEYRDLKLDEIVRRICQPFDLLVRTECDVGAPFPVFSIDAGDRAMEAIERGCRQRAVLAVSDGIEGLLLTRGGTRRAPAPIKLPGNVQQGVVNRSWKDRFSEYVVKGQTRSPRAGGPALNGTPAPLSPDTPAPARPRQADERATIVMTGRAEDSEITRWRPTVRLSKTQSGGATVQEQAEWMLRVARGGADVLTYTVRDWRGGEKRGLWRPNELVMVDDPLAGILGEMLVAAVTFRYGEQDGHQTELTVKRPEAFDLVAEGDDDRNARRQRRDRQRPADGTPRPLSPEDPARR